MLTLKDLEQAAELVRTVVPPTPQYAWPKLAARLGCRVWVKHENHTPTGAFKVRGGLIYMSELARAGTAPRGVISATRGNHGQSMKERHQWAGKSVAVIASGGNIERARFERVLNGVTPIVP
jgi:threonine dehydratase